MQSVTQHVPATRDGSEISTPTLTWSDEAHTAAPHCPAHQTGAEQAFQSAFSSELKSLCCQVTKEREVAVLTGLKKNQSKRLLHSALWNDRKLNFQHEEAEMQLIYHYPLQMQNFLKKAVERMVYQNWLNITCSAVHFFPTTGICHSCVSQVSSGTSHKGLFIEPII